MLYRRFGRTNLQMPVFSCGGMRYQYKWQDVPLSEVPPENQANLEATIRQSLELGVNHIETARGYGSSERQLGVLLPKLPREKMIIQTKVGPDASPETFTANFEDSLKRLGLQYVDLLSIHGINDDKTCEQALGRPGRPGCLAAARAIQKRGLARHIGFSTHAPLRIILDAIRHPRDGGFDYVNLHWYWIFQKNGAAIEEAKWRDMGVFIISPADKGGKLYAPPEKLTRLCAPLHPLVFNSLFCLSKPEVHTLSIGAARPGDFDLAMQTLEHVGKAQETLAPILARLNAALAEAVPAEVRDPFALNFPEPQDAPGKLNLPVILWLRNLVKAFDMQGYGEMRYNLFGSGGHWFPGSKVEDAGKLDLGAVARSSGIEAERLRALLKETHEMLGKAAVKRLSES
jgi:predicted aldo/keto reductase-like oxidoreductase